VSIGERSVRERDWKKRKARLLFTMLMIQRGQDVPREQIFDHLWPDMDEPRAKSNLYVVWSAMKSVLMGDSAEKGAKCPYVESLGGVCRSIRETVRTDVDAFEAACARAHEAEAEGRSADALRAYRQISDLYRGDLLPGDCYEDWFVNLREHYRSEFMDAMLRATELLLEANDPHTALIFVRRAIQHDQFREDLYQAALRCQIAAGQRSSAIDTYMQCRDKLCEELGLDPSAEMRALYSEILAMEDRPSPVAFDPLSD
jgi:DNA-binding SARP family transcriptional activator